VVCTLFGVLVELLKVIFEGAPIAITTELAPTYMVDRHDHKA
jgi:hypothetical protein